MSAPDKPPPETGGLTMVRDATCTFCGCMCDDIDLAVHDHRIVEAHRTQGAAYPGDAPSGEAGGMLEILPEAELGDEGRDVANQPDVRPDRERFG